MCLVSGGFASVPAGGVVACESIPDGLSLPNDTADILDAESATLELRLLLRQGTVSLLDGLGQSIEIGLACDIGLAAVLPPLSSLSDFQICTNAMKCNNRLPNFWHWCVHDINALKCINRLPNFWH